MLAVKRGLLMSQLGLRAWRVYRYEPAVRGRELEIIGAWAAKGLETPVVFDGASGAAVACWKEISPKRASGTRY